MITKFKLFEDIFYQDGNFWFVEIAINDYSAFEPYQAPADLDNFDNVIKYAKELVEILNKKGIIFRTYTNRPGKTNGIIFLFRKKEDIPDFLKGHQLELTQDVWTKVWEDEIPDNDIDRFFNSTKFGL